MPIRKKYEIPCKGHILEVIVNFMLTKTIKYSDSPSDVVELHKVVDQYLFSKMMAPVSNKLFQIIRMLSTEDKLYAINAAIRQKDVNLLYYADDDGIINMIDSNEVIREAFLYILEIIADDVQSFTISPEVIYKFAKKPLLKEGLYKFSVKLAMGGDGNFLNILQKLSPLPYDVFVFYSACKNSDIKAREPMTEVGKNTATMFAEKIIRWYTINLEGKRKKVTNNAETGNDKTDNNKISDNKTADNVKTTDSK